MRQCKVCLEHKPVAEFHVTYSTEKAEYRRKVCKVCQNAKTRAWHAENPDARQRTYVARTWGMTLEEYKNLLSSGCEVCGTLEGLVIDHDHSCCDSKGGCQNCIRGVLCSRHNLAEGSLRGDPNEAYALAEYMKKHWKGETL